MVYIESASAIEGRERFSPVRLLGPPLRGREWIKNEDQITGNHKVLPTSVRIEERRMS